MPLHMHDRPTVTVSTWLVPSLVPLLICFGVVVTFSRAARLPISLLVTLLVTLLATWLVLLPAPRLYWFGLVIWRTG